MTKKKTSRARPADRRPAPGPRAAVGNDAAAMASLRAAKPRAVSSESKSEKKLSAMTDEALAAVSDDVEREGRDRSLWTETEDSRAQQPERAKWVDENMTAISIRMPNGMLDLLRAVAAAEGIGYQTLIKKWLHRDLIQLAKQRREKRSELAKSLKVDVEEREELLETLNVPHRR
ncbi:MAG: hypothetical protein Q8O67_11235 [Deltaproteobacteria bacterium]|nr:hypothetical protein [Deltaproteobacteria bacterium]